MIHFISFEEINAILLSKKINIIGGFHIGDDCRNSFAFPNEFFNETLIENIHNYIGQNILISK